MNGTAIHGVASWRRGHHTPVSPRPLRDLTVIALENIINACIKQGVQVNPAEKVPRESCLRSAPPGGELFKFRRRKHDCDGLTRAEDRYWFLYRLAP